MVDRSAKKQRSNLDFEEDLALLSFFLSFVFSFFRSFFPSFFLFAEGDEESYDFDDFFLALDQTGPNTQQASAEKVNAGLCRNADREMLGELLKKFPQLCAETLIERC